MSPIKGEWKKNGSVFKEQKRLAKRILSLFRTKVLVTLCAPPQWGKTGVSLYVAYKLSRLNVNPENVFFVTAMSDRSWIDQMTERVLPSWKKNVYHRNTLHKMRDRIKSLKEKKDILIIVDECHLANRLEHTLGKITSNLEMKDPEFLKENNIKILQISATPSNALIDAEEWRDHHSSLCPKIRSGYVSFQCLLDEGRIIDPFNLEDPGDSEEYLELITIGKPKYHFVRSVCNGPYGSESYKVVRENLETGCFDKKIQFIELNMERSRKEIQDIYKYLNKEPKEHMVILIKNMLGASKTLQDKHIGSVHESVPSKKDYSCEVQGLPGRMCGWNKQRGKNGPLIFCDHRIVEQYIRLYESEFSYELEDFEWSDSRLKVSLNGKIRSKDSYLSLNSELEEEDINVSSAVPYGVILDPGQAERIKRTEIV